MTSDKPKRVIFSVSVTEETRDECQRIANEEGHGNRSLVVSRFIREGIERTEQNAAN